MLYEKMILLCFLLCMYSPLGALEQAPTIELENQVNQEQVHSQERPVKRVRFQVEPDQDDLMRLDYLIQSMHDFNNFSDQSYITSLDLDTALEHQFMMRGDEYQKKLYQACLKVISDLYKISAVAFYQLDKMQQVAMLLDCLDNHEDQINSYIYGDHFVQHIKDLESKAPMQR